MLGAKGVALGAKGLATKLWRERRGAKVWCGRFGANYVARNAWRERRKAWRERRGANEAGARGSAEW
eukprot:3329687-Pleurochrysis_carterae.AAC.5